MTSTSTERQKRSQNLAPVLVINSGNSLIFVRKISAPIKIKSALPPPQTPPLKGGILRTWFFLQKERIFPGVHKIGAAISGPRIADTNFTDTRIFLIFASTMITSTGFYRCYALTALQ